MKKKYRVFFEGVEGKSEEAVIAESAFAARSVIAAKYGMATALSTEYEGIAKKQSIHEVCRLCDTYCYGDCTAYDD